MQDESVHSCLYDRDYNSSGLENPTPLDRSEMEAMDDGRVASRGGRFQVRTDIRSPNRGGGARGQMFAPYGIVLHHTVGEESGDLRTLTSPAAQVSSNDYITKQGVIYELVPFPGRAWHAGDSELHGVRDWNDHGWGIEIENWGNGRDPYPRAQIEAIVWRCRERRRTLGIADSKMLTRHRDVCLPRGRKTDTSDNFPYGEVRRRVFAATDPTDEDGGTRPGPVDELDPPPMDAKKYNFAAIGEADKEVAKAATKALEGVGISSFTLADTPEKVRYISRAARDSATAGRLVCIVVGGSAKEHLSPEAREDVGKYDLDASDLWSAMGGGLDQTKRILAEKHLPEIWSRESSKLSALLTDAYREKAGMIKEVAPEEPKKPDKPDKPERPEKPEELGDPGSILGASFVTRGRAVRWLEENGAHERAYEWVDLAWKWGKATGIRPDLLLAQEMLETGWGNFTGEVPPEFCNVAGIKVRDSGPDDAREDHERFPSWSEGVRAHANHLCAYCGASPVSGPDGEGIHDQYFVIVVSLPWSGTVETTGGFAGRYAPRADYAALLHDKFLDPLRAGGGDPGGGSLPKGTVWGVSDVEYLVPFNYRRQTSHGLQNVHKGEDIVANEGSDILAVAEGRVVRLRENRPDSGYWQDFTVLYPSVNKYVLYGHVMRGASLPEGSRFKKGQKISRIGTLKDALNTTEHTHVQVWGAEAAMLAFDNSAAVDPKSIRLALGEEEYEGAVAQAESMPGNWSCPACIEE